MKKQRRPHGAIARLSPTIRKENSHVVLATTSNLACAALTPPHEVRWLGRAQPAEVALCTGISAVSSGACGAGEEK